MYLSIIIPTYNEAENIEKLVFLIESSLSSLEYEIIIVDDNSPDGTGKIAEGLSNKYPVKIIHRESKLGLSTAVLDGFKIAKGGLLCAMDSDLSHPPEKIIEMANYLEEENADMVIGSRLAKGGGVENWPLHRKTVAFLGRCLARPLTRVNDPLSGFFIITKNVIKNIEFNPLGYKILLEILVKGKYKKAVEYPFIFKDRVCGKTKLDKKTMAEYLIHILKLYYYKFIIRKA